MDYDSIIKQFPFLASYPRASIEHWISLARIACNDHRFGRNVAQAQALFVAHATVFAHAPIGFDQNTKEPKRAIPAHSAAPALPQISKRTAHLHAKRRALVGWGETTHGLAMTALAKY